ncbi:hypothetical protein [Micromonospora sp. LH3U1]|uniref:hypothetical protein n=1 Tax=Micromonospora sp. LH3U1 TaxID=3018339 RepID=UPI00234BC9E3|nr:hypothetical protein [Micromonospora sp. LH3U1]WCN83251.1 hypothetical protein PCA76_09455 [Micromonospora sp. LH3U1]
MPRRLVPLLLALAACTAATAAPTTPLQPPRPTATPWPGLPEWPGQQEVMDAATVVGNAASLRWPRAYAGVAVDLPARLLLVQRIPTPGLDAAVRALVPAVAVRFTDARYSKVALDEWVADIGVDFDYWQRRGVQLRNVGAEPGQYVEVGTDDPQRDAGKIRAHYPHMTLHLVQGVIAVPVTAG